MIEATGNDLVVIASDPNELAESQKATIERVKLKKAEAEQEITAAEAVMDEALRAGLSMEAAKPMIRRARSRLLYLDKVQAALEAGFLIVPAMRGDTVAIRVKRESPAGKVQSREGYKPSLNDQKAQLLPAGQGRYVDPTPFVTEDEHKVRKPDGREITVHTAWASEFDEHVVLPVEFMRPTVIHRTGLMMQRKIFDEIAVIGGRASRSADPLVVGRILDGSQNRRPLHFLIAWFLDTATI
jgi:hypothetical protein